MSPEHLSAQDWFERLPGVALSIRQPWCWAITHAGKDIENREWWTDFRGPFLLHAGKTLEKGVIGDMAGDFELPFDLEIPSESSLALGGIVGMASLTDCVSRSPSRWFFGRWGFCLAQARSLPFVPLKGVLGFFPVAEDVRRELARLLAGGAPREEIKPVSELQDGPLFSWAREANGA